MQPKIRKELLEWGIFLSIVAALYFTGWYRQITGFIQRGVLETRLIQPETKAASRAANYDFKLLDKDGQHVNFRDFRGRTVFLNIWATWCPPCIAEMPDIHDLYREVGHEVAFVMLSVDENPEVAREFIKRKGFSFPVYTLETRLPHTYNSSAIPTTYVLSPDGLIVAEHHGLAKYNTEKFRNFLMEVNAR